MVESSENQSYTVVARRYRPTTFGELIGQSQVATALTNAIQQNRVGHAYLFTGARGVGKTSSARIFAKCLNCKDGPTTEPCNDCDPCLSISAGEDVDVIEIDGASNRGIDNIRELRSNANIRPSRSNFKIYIIDEVHMLSREAFNALLKTLEEPPGHVKFIFCTTDPEKIPITVLSRCQRFDFVPVQTNQIRDRLNEICANEGVAAEEAALNVLAQRAKGSMRDSQSLLEQLLSFSSDSISVADVHQLLGTADSGIIFEIANGLVQADAQSVLGSIDRSIRGGVDAGQLTEQLLGHFRDVMTFKVGCGSEIFQHLSPDDLEKVEALGGAIEIEPLLTLLQILDKTLVSMRQTAHGRTLLEMACVRICHLSQLQNVSVFLSALNSGKLDTEKLASALGAVQSTSTRSSPSLQKKNDRPLNAAQPVSTATKPMEESVGNAAESTFEMKGSSSTIRTSSDSRQESETKSEARPAIANNGSPTTSSRPHLVIDSTNVEKYWRQALDSIGDTTAVMAASYQKLALVNDNQLVVTLTDSYNKEACERPEKKQRLESALQSATGRRFRIDFALDPVTGKDEAEQPVASRRQTIRELHQHPLLQSAISTFDGEIIDFRKTKPGKSE